MIEPIEQYGEIILILRYYLLFGCIPCMCYENQGPITGTPRLKICLNTNFLIDNDNY